MLRLRWLPLLLLLAGAPAPARAEGPSRNEARARFDRGVVFFQRADYANALDEFRRSWEVGGRPFQPLFNIAVTESRLFRYDAAAQSFARYLADGGARVPAARREQVERELAAIHAVVAELRVRVEGAPAEVTVDGDPVGKSPIDRAILVGPGRHVVRATREGAGAAEQVIEATPRASLEVTLAPRSPVAASQQSAPPPGTPPSETSAAVQHPSAAAQQPAPAATGVPPAASAAPAPTSPEPPTGGGRSRVGVALIAVGAVVLAAGIGAGVAAAVVDAPAHAHAPGDLGAREQAYADATPLYYATWAAVGVGAAVVVAGVVAHVATRPREPAATARAPRPLVVVAPWSTGAGGGLVAAGTF